MIIYAITSTYEAPYEYHTTRAAAEWALNNKSFFNPSYDYIEEIEVID